MPQHHAAIAVNLFVVEVIKGDRDVVSGWQNWCVK